MKTIITLAFVFFTSFGFCQTTEVETEIFSRHNIFEPAIIQIYPDSFPEVSVVFQAQNEFGKPLWLLQKEELGVFENEKECEVRRLINISKDKPLNVGIVFDHSGSMIENPKQDPNIGSDTEIYVYAGYTLPKNYTPAILYAKRGVLGFLKEIKNPRDSVMYVGFSSEVSEVVKLTNRFADIKYYVQKVQPDGGTAFYDALMTTLKKMKPSDSNSVIVALTDGQDNSSRYSKSRVIQLAQEKEIPIYIIGLGNVQSKLLKSISNQTNGFYYYTDDPKTLSSIYLKIKEQIQSIYQLDYVSNSQDFEEEERSLQFYFKNDTLTFSEHTSRYELPDEVIDYLKEQEVKRLKQAEKEALAQQQAAHNALVKKRFALGGLGSVLLLGIGSFVVYRRRKPKVEARIKKAYPNPFTDSLTLNYEIDPKLNAASINIMTVNGKLVYSKKIDPNLNYSNLNLSVLESGVYVLQIGHDNGVSEKQKIIKVDRF